MKSYRYFLLATTIVLFLLVVMGNVVRVSDAAQACPDWPTCFGQFNFPAQALARLQVVHRALAGLSTLLIVIAAAWAVRRRADRLIWISWLISIPLMAFQVLLGAELELVPSPGLLGALHLGLALVVLGLAAATTTVAFIQYAKEIQPDFAPVLSGETYLKPLSLSQDRPVFQTFRAPFARLSLAAALAIFLVLVSGAAVVASGAGQACGGWLLCAGGLPVSLLGWLELFHRGITGVAGVLITLAFWQAWQSQRSQRVILAAVTAGYILFLGQVLLGMAKVSQGFPTDLVGLHAASSAALWAVLVVWLAALALADVKIDAEAAAAMPGMPAGRRLRDFFLLNKPVIVLLLLVTTYAGMVLGARKLPDFSLTVWTMLGGALAAGGASALNQYIDRELDKNMQRTAKRPLPAGRLTAAEGLAYGLGACLAAFFLLAVNVNLLSALLSLAGMIYYVLLYSIWLKKLTVQNIVIGGGAGAIPPLVGWAAASGSLNIPSLFLFAIVFLWTPPHFWALALVRRNDYARAGVPMLPVVQGEKAARWQIFLYTLELVGLTLLMPVLHVTGAVFLYAALALGAWLISAAWRVWKQGGNKTAWKMYRYSSMYLACLFLALVLDVLI